MNRFERGQSLPVSDHVRIPIDTLLSSPTPFNVVREDGMIMCCNPPMANLFFPGRTPNEVVGTLLQQHEPRAFFGERMRRMQELAKEGKHGIFRDIWQGRQIIVHIRQLGHMPHDAMHYMLVMPIETTGEATPIEHDQTLWIDPEHQDLGRLALLSQRELEVLAYVGKGLTAAEIAKCLHRSQETVISHKSALMRKLVCDTSLQLAMIAQRAGLSVEDAERYGR